MVREMYKESLAPIKTSFLLLIALNIIYITNLPAKDFTPVVQIGDLEIIGRHDENKGVDSFLGIPFAMPPVGDLRWAEPIEYKFTEKVFKAQKFAPACMQGSRIVDWYKRLISHFDGEASSFSTPVFSEDCLYLNIWRPANFHQLQSLPVIVYIHGGSNKAGWSYEPNYHGYNYAKHGVYW